MLCVAGLSRGLEVSRGLSIAICTSKILFELLGCFFFFFFFLFFFFYLCNLCGLCDLFSLFYFILVALFSEQFQLFG